MSGRNRAILVPADPGNKDDKTIFGFSTHAMGSTGDALNTCG